MPTEIPSPAALLEKVLACCAAEQSEVCYRETREASTRYANNAITQNVAKRAAVISVRSAFGQRVGHASTTDFTDEGIRQCVQSAEAIARASEPDTEFLPLPGPQQYPSVTAYDPRVAEATPADRAEAVLGATRQAEAAGQRVAGSYATNSLLTAMANSAGLYHEQRMTDTRFVCTAITDDSSGWAQRLGYRWEDADGADATAAALRKAADARDPQDLPPGDYTVVLEPAAVADFFGFLGWTMDAKSAHEGRSAFTGKEGERIGVPGLTLSTRPDHPESPADTASEDGLPLPATDWIEDGVLKTLSYGRYWAGKTGRPFTGGPGNLIMGGGEHSLEDLIASVDRGLLVTRFWYIRFVDPMKLLLTGMTRDGLYLIEDGKVTGAVKNLRFNESPLRCLERISALGPQARTGRYGGLYVPAMRVDGFRFTSGTAF